MGPFRLNFSRAGMGWSFGGRGLRYTRSARGQRYVTAGAGGLYYRHDLGRTPTSSAPGPSLGLPAPAVGNSVVLPIGNTQLKSGDLADLVTQAQQGVRIDYLGYAAGGLLLFLLLVTGHGLACFLFTVAAVPGAVYLRRWEFERRVVDIDYAAVLAADAGRFVEIQQAVGHIAADPCLRGAPLLPAGTYPQITDPVGAIEFSREEPPYVRTLIDAPNLVSRWWHACFLPHGVLVVADRRATLISYQDIAVTCTVFQAVDPEHHPAARVVGSTWRHTTKAGKPDQRYRDNPVLPICQYAQILVTTPVLVLRLVATQEDAARRTVDGLAKVIRHARMHP